MPTVVFISYYQGDAEFTDAVEGFLTERDSDATMICVSNNMMAFSFTVEDVDGLNTALTDLIEQGEYDYDDMVFVQGQVV